MSEIKGQLLGIMLVLILFGSVSAILIAVFSKMGKSVSDNVDSVISSMNSQTPAQNDDLLTYYSK